MLNRDQLVVLLRFLVVLIVLVGALSILTTFNYTKTTKGRARRLIVILILAVWMSLTISKLVGFLLNQNFFVARDYVNLVVLSLCVFIRIMKCVPVQFTKVHQVLFTVILRSFLAKSALGHGLSRSCIV